LTVGELKKLLETYSDDIPILSDGGFDHSYITLRSLRQETVAADGNFYFEWSSPEDNPGEVPIEALVFSTN
jgi:hypothetical protein